MKHLRALLVLVVLVNLAVIGYLLARRPPGDPGTSAMEAVKPLLTSETMEETRYDLSRRAKELDVILISMDALRYDRTGLSGSGRGLTPNLDSFAQEAVVFHDATTVAPWTLPAHMSLWTGRWPSVHGVTNKLRLLSKDQLVPTSLSPGIETFPDHLIRAGWKAVGFTGGAGVQASYGFGRGFETYLDDRPFAGLDYSAPKAIEWLKAHGGERFFMFLHGYDVHGQHPLAGPPARDQVQGYQGSLDGSIEEQARLREKGLDAARGKPGTPPSLAGALGPEDGRFLAEVYDRKVKGADERLGAFLAQLKVLGIYDRAVIAIVSDHGDEFLEHGHLDHGHTLYQEQLHVVMAIRFPGAAKRHDVKEPVRLLDLFPTVFAALGIEGPSGVDGVSLVPLLRGTEGAAPTPVVAETDYRLFVHQRAIRRGPWKLVLDLADGQRQLFHLGKDPGEAQDVSSSEPRITYEMEQELRGWMDGVRTNPQHYLGIQQAPIETF